MKDDMKKILILITTSFPFGKLEPFIESELKYYNSFDKVLCFAIHRAGDAREIDYPNNFVFYSVKDYTIKRDCKYIFKLLFKKIFWKEILTLIKSSRFSTKNISRLISLSLQAEHYHKILKNRIKEFDKANGGNNKFYFYSYWMVEHALCCIKLKKEFKNSVNITRAHGYDLYEYRNKGKYIPYRKHILDNSNLVLPISQDGYEYLIKKYGQHQNIELSRLGTADYGISQSKEKPHDLTIVSCSWCTAVKRIDRIITSLALIKDLNIKWIHIGDGQLFESLKQKAGETLPLNIDHEFTGPLSNKQILELYKNKHIDLFINTSSSEGIPVSIMEVQSFGIPVIATDVGGVKEIITHNENGYLINKDFKDAELANLIKDYAEKHTDEKKILREASRRLWEKKFSARKNYTEIFNRITEIQ